MQLTKTIQKKSVVSTKPLEKDYTLENLAATKAQSTMPCIATLCKLSRAFHKFLSRNDIKQKFVIEKASQKIGSVK